LASKTAVGGPKIFPPKRVSSRRDLSDAMMSYWAEFAYFGNPGRGRRNKDLPQWWAWGGAQGRSLVLDTPRDQGIRLTDAGLTAEAIYKRLTDDKRLKSPKERCVILHAVLALFLKTTGDANNSLVQAKNGLVQECA
jgi:para-nitrobenzyl esterase